MGLILVVLFFVWAASLRRHNEEQRRVERVNIIIADSAALQLLSAEDVIDIVHQAGLWPLGQRVDSLSLRDINRAIEECPFVAQATTFIDYDNTLSVEIVQRKPMVRVSTSEGEDFYLTRGLYMLPVEYHKPLDVPIVTGSLKLPCPKGFEGDLRVWAKANKKNSDKNYRFIYKLLNFVVLSEPLDQIVQIVLIADGDDEPKVEVVPRNGNYTVELGHIGDKADIERKLECWQRFVEAGVVDLNTGGTLSVAYDNQAVWRMGN